MIRRLTSIAKPSALWSFSYMSAMSLPGTRKAVSGRRHSRARLDEASAGANQCNRLAARICCAAIRYRQSQAPASLSQAIPLLPQRVHLFRANAVDAVFARDSKSSDLSRTAKAASNSPGTGISTEGGSLVNRPRPMEFESRIAAFAHVAGIGPA